MTPLTVGAIIAAVGIWAVLAGGVWTLLFARGEDDAQQMEAKA